MTHLCKTPGVNLLGTNCNEVFLFNLLVFLWACDVKQSLVTDVWCKMEQW